jgi:hypothetical protein
LGSGNLFVCLAFGKKKKKKKERGKRAWARWAVVEFDKHNIKLLVKPYQHHLAWIVSPTQQTHLK